ncbi:acyltransferase family protein [Frigoribacterium faeni]|uniref:acyltransferase family protein n=1 Tax=Frigoribacterium faeni TaxID=145483 RepID=UPI00141AF235|nr:acyltransferase family protein [Frigoribacterium faeni]NIJ05849.1 peptidoglycan/LPS O-acetylase OafA/YrhL [Frigoribacterium faeni]
MDLSRTPVVPLTPRADLEGLRAVAVAVVVAYHLTLVPLGGVVGVDVFFVISGYLITRLLLDEHDRAGGVDLRAFYLRRARRLLPAAAVVLSATVAAAWLVWSTPRALDVLLDAVAAASSSENWHLIAAGTDYLQHDGPVSPLQHFWSLAVEEQFYVVWPLVAVAVLAAARRQGPTRRRALVGCVAVVATAASALWSWHLSATAVETAYFEPFGRAWELGAGAACGALVPLVALPSDTWRRRLTSLGVVLVAVTAVGVDPTSGFPWPGALPAVLGAALIVSLGSGTMPGLPRVLTWRPLLWAGRRSYSIYLWHFPVTVLGTALVDAWWRVPASIVLTLALSAVTYRVVEVPARRRRRQVSPSERTTAPGHRGIAVAAVVTLVVVTASAAQTRSPTKLGDPSALAALVGLSSRPPGLDEVPPLPVVEPRQTVLAALEADAWTPAQRAEIDAAYREWLTPAMDVHTGCRNDPTPDPAAGRTCRWGPADAEHTAVVIGDSVAASWTSAVAAALVPQGWAVVALAFAGCTPIDLPPDARYADPAFERACEVDREAMLALPAAEDADLVVVSGGVNVLARRVDAVGVEAARDEWRTAAESTLARLTAAAPRVVLLGAPPAGPAIQDCFVRPGDPDDCLSTITPAQRAQVVAEAEAAAAAGPAAEHVDVTDWFCADDRCPATLGGRLVRQDRSHLTEATSLALRDLLGDRLLGSTSTASP